MRATDAALESAIHPLDRWAATLEVGDGLSTPTVALMADWHAFEGYEPEISDRSAKVKLTKVGGQRDGQRYRRIGLPGGAREQTLDDGQPF